MIDCLENIIGLTRREYECFPTLGIASFEPTESKSGLYLDELEGLHVKMVNESHDDEGDSLWRSMHLAKINAIQQVYTDIFTSLSSRYQARSAPYRGVLGDRWTKNATVRNGVASFKLQVKDLPGATMRIKRLGLILDSDATVSVNIANTGRMNGRHVQEESNLTTVDVTTQAHFASYTTPETPLILPLDGSEYEFSYAVEDFTPKETKLHCGCGGTGNKLKDYFASSLSTYTQGIILDVDISCDTSDLICQNMADDPVLMQVIGNAVRYKTGEYVLNHLKTSPSIGRHTMMDDAQLNASINMYAEQYQNRIDWLGQNLKADVNSCFTCGNKSGIRKVGIFA